MAKEDAAEPTEPQNTAAEAALGDEIDGDELAALLGQATEPAPPAATPAPATTASDSDAFGDEISEEELVALQMASGGKLGKPKPAAPAATPVAAPAATATLPKPTPPDAKPATPAFSPVTPVAVPTASDAGMSLLMDVPLRVSVELGRIDMTLQEVLELGRGSIIELERLAGEPVDILVNDKLIGHGEVVVVDEYFGVKITELIEPKG